MDRPTPEARTTHRIASAGTAHRSPPAGPIPHTPPAGPVPRIPLHRVTPPRATHRITLANLPHRVVLASAVAWVLAACGDSDADGSAALAQLPSIELVEEARIGSVDDPETGFSAIYSADVGDDGRVYVFEAQAMEFRVYDASGDLVRRFGGRGEGPGEFGSNPASFGVHGDTVWAIELLGQRRLTLFDREGTLLGTARLEGVSVRLPMAGTVGIVLPRMMDRQGFLLGELAIFTGARNAPPLPPEDPEADPDVALVPRVRFAGDGSVVDTVGWYPYNRRDSEAREIGIGSTTHRIPPPPRDDPLVVTLPDGHVLVERATADAPDRATFRVLRVRFGADTVYDRTFGYEPVPFSESQLDEVAWGAVRRPSGAVAIIGGVAQAPEVPADSMERFRRIRSSIDYPAFQPPVQADEPGRDGSVWLRREDDGDEHHRWLVLAPDGEPRGEVRLPRNHRLAWAAGDQAWIIEADELGVPWLVRYRFETAER